MACRGRGTLEIRPSASPFFQPTSREQESRTIDFAAPRIARPPQPKPEDGFDFSFLYARANDDIGKKIPTSGSKLGSAMAKRLSLRDVTRLKSGIDRCSAAPEEKEDAETITDPTKLAEAIVKVYKHNPKDEHIMYQTSANEYGAQAPTVATLTAERSARSQQFSNSFNGIKYRDQGLNTSITRSNVHDGLDFF